MKLKLAPVIFAVFFILFLILGVETGESIFSKFWGSNDASASASLTEVGRKEDVQEPFLLLIQVDELTRDDPSLEGVWLLSYGNSREALLFFPLMPSQADDGVSRDQALRQAFHVEGQGEVSSDFFDLLGKRNLAWSGYLVLDKHALSGVIGSMGGVRIENTLFSPAETYTLWGDSPEARMETRAVQSQFISGICERMAVLDGGVSLRHRFDQLQDHLYLEDMSLETLVQIWAPLVSGGDVSCQFPTISP